MTIAGIPGKKLFDGVLQDNGTEYVAKQPVAADLHAMQYFGPWIAEVSDMWFLPTHGTLNTSTTNYIRGKRPGVERDGRDTKGTGVFLYQ